MLCTHHPPFTISWLSSRKCPHKNRPQPCLLGHLPLGIHTTTQRKMTAAMQARLALLPLLSPDLLCRTLKGIQQPAILRSSHPLNEAFRLLTQESSIPCQAPVKQNTEILSLGRYAWYSHVANVQSMQQSVNRSISCMAANCRGVDFLNLIGANDKTRVTCVSQCLCPTCR